MTPILFSRHYKKTYGNNISYTATERTLFVYCLQASIYWNSASPRDIGGGEANSHVWGQIEVVPGDVVNVIRTNPSGSGVLASAVRTAIAQLTVNSSIVVSCYANAMVLSDGVSAATYASQSRLDFIAYRYHPA